MAVNFCSNCGAKLRVGAKFCGSCGQKIQSEEKQLPPMPYEKPKSAVEVYVEKKAATQAQTKPTSIQAIFSNAKANTTDTAAQKPVPKSMAQIYAEAEANSQANPPPAQIDSDIILLNSAAPIPDKRPQWIKKTSMD